MKEWKIVCQQVLLLIILVLLDFVSNSSVENSISHLNFSWGTVEF